MPEPSIAGLFNIQNRFVRSIHLERDFADPSSLKGYVLTSQARQSLDRLAAGLSPTSGQRAWRMTGDYGSGKSSFALLLAHVFGGQFDTLPKNLRHGLHRPAFSTAQLSPVLVTGAREPLATAILRALARTIQGAKRSGPVPGLCATLRKQAELASVQAITDDDVISAVQSSIDYLKRTGRSKGVLLILDELGKFLEFSALHPEKQDIYLLQKLAETASRSGAAPLFVVGLLHQGFNAYADTLSQWAQKEWEKVAGRFEELLFSHPLDQISMLVAEALQVRTARLPTALIQQAERDMHEAVSLGWYGPGANRKELVSAAARLYPLHSTVLPALVRLFSRFGQNERSLFSFLLSQEPFGLQDFAQRRLQSAEFYRLHNLFDYARTTFGHRLSIQSYRSHWNQIDSIVESYPAEHVRELELLKTVGLLNLLDAPQLTPSAVAIGLATVGASGQRAGRVKETIDTLQRQKHVLYLRGTSAGYCLWPHTSVNLERAYEEAHIATGSPQRISVLLNDYLEARPLVARRHYIQTGNLRHFEVTYVSVASLPPTLERGWSESADGRIVVVLCETEEERKEAFGYAQARHLADQPFVLVAIPRPLSALTGLVHEAHRWQWISSNVLELNSDSYAAAEVSRQVTATRMMLHKAILQFVGLQQSSAPTDLAWFRCGRPERAATGRQLLTLLSDVCDEVYPLAPSIRNELVNRRQLSAAAAAARMRLIERLFKHSREPKLGMDPVKKPPEMSMYLSVLIEANLHQDHGTSWALTEPSQDHDVCKVGETLACIKNALIEHKGRRVGVSALLGRLRRPPYGVRDGLNLLLLAVFAQIHEQDLAFFENGSFLREVAGDDFHRMAKDPGSFEIQYYPMSTVRAGLYRRLLDVLQLSCPSRDRVDILDVVRPLCSFAAQLPLYTQRTARLSRNAAAVRAALIAAREPATLLFTDLPQALGFALGDEAGEEESQQFVSALKSSLDELRFLYPLLLEGISRELSQTFDHTASLADLRLRLAQDADRLLIGVQQPLLRAFCLRLADRALADTEWLEAIGSLLCSKPPAKWSDRDLEQFSRELSQITAAFRHTQTLLFPHGSADGAAFRISITRHDGSECEQVLQVNADEEPRVFELERQLLSIVKEQPRLGIAAATRVVWQVLKREDHPHD
jgi:hypothetical protein